MGKNPKQKPPHLKMGEKNNGLTKTQEVLYQREFKQAKEVAKTQEERHWKCKLKEALQSTRDSWLMRSFLYFVSV